MRILPRLNEEVNEEWISDKTRFIWDGLKSQRLDRPYVRRGGRLEPATWGEAFAAIATKIGGDLGEADRGDRRRPRRGRGDVRAEVADAGARLAASRLPAGRRQARPEARPRELHLQPDHRRHRPRRRDPDRRLEPAPRGRGAQCAHPAALARRRRHGSA